MHVNPYLIIEGEKYLVDDFAFGFSQKPNAVGLPATFPVFQGLDVVIRGHYPGFFLERWACASGQPKLVELVLKPLVLGSGPTRVFTFFDAHLVHFTKNYSEKKNPPVEMHLKITAGGVRDSFSKSEYSAPWRETFEKPGVVAARSTIEEECVDSGTGDTVGQEEFDTEGLDIQAGIAWLESIAISQEDANEKSNYKILYVQEGGKLRTSYSTEALQYSDCSELVCRYLQKIGWSENVKHLNTSALSRYSIKNPHRLIKRDENYIPKIGDIFLWVNHAGSNGHTGIVVAYDKNNDVVTTIESINFRERPYGASKSINLQGVVKLKWKRTSRHLINHPTKTTRYTADPCRFYTPSKL